MRLIDFEKGGFHFSLLDAANARLSMPHCFWAGRLPERVITDTEAAYWEAASSALPQLTDDEWRGRAATEACAYWILSNGAWLVHQPPPARWCVRCAGTEFTSRCRCSGIR